MQTGSLAVRGTFNQLLFTLMVDTFISHLLCPYYQVDRIREVEVASMRLEEAVKFRKQVRLDNLRERLKN